MNIQGIQGVRATLGLAVTGIALYFLDGRRERLGRLNLIRDSFERNARYSLMMSEHGGFSATGLDGWRRQFQMFNVYGPFGLYTGWRRFKTTIKAWYEEIIKSWPTPFAIAGTYMFMPKDYKLHNLVGKGIRSIYESGALGSAGSHAGKGLWATVKAAAALPGLAVKALAYGGLPAVTMLLLAGFGYWQFTRVINGDEREEFFAGAHYRFGYTGNHVDLNKSTLWSF